MGSQIPAHTCKFVEHVYILTLVKNQQFMSYIRQGYQGSHSNENGEFVFIWDFEVSKEFPSVTQR